MPHNEPTSSTVRRYSVASRATIGVGLAVHRAALPFAFYESVDRSLELAGENHNLISCLEEGPHFGGGILAFGQKVQEEATQRTGNYESKLLILGKGGNLLGRPVALQFSALVLVNRR